jgi:putative phosphoribosyl transferase
MDYKGQSVMVLAIPNGGIPLGAEIATALEAELDVVVVRKLPLPLSPESGFGALADDGSIILNEELVRREGVTQAQVNEQVGLVTSQVRQLSLLYRKDRPLSMVRGKIAIIVDDGLASGFTMLAAVESVKRRRPREIVVAVPAASSAALERVRPAAGVVTLAEGTGARFTVADYYRHWHDVADAEVTRVLDAHRGYPRLKR